MSKSMAELHVDEEIERLSTWVRDFAARYPGQKVTVSASAPLTYWFADGSELELEIAAGAAVVKRCTAAGFSWKAACAAVEARHAADWSRFEAAREQLRCALLEAIEPLVRPMLNLLKRIVG